MFKFTVRIKDVNGLSAKLKDIEKQMTHPQRILNNVGLHMLKMFTKRFDQEGPGWKPSYRKQLSGGKTLSKTRRLLNSHSFQVIGSAVRIGTNLIYARIHQLGGVIKAKPGNKFGGFLVFRYKGVVKGKRGAKMGYTWARVKQVTIPERSWAFFDSSDIQICREITGKSIMVGK